MRLESNGHAHLGQMTAFGVPMPVTHLDRACASV